MLIIILIHKSSCATFVKSRLSSLTFAQALTPYVGIPNCANIQKYDINDVAKETFPIPSGCKTREAYGKVTNGKITDDNESTAFIIKFNLIDVFSCFFVLTSFIVFSSILYSLLYLRYTLYLPF